MVKIVAPETYRMAPANIAAGLTIFAIGLFKKTVLADGIAQYASPMFSAAAAGELNSCTHCCSPTTGDVCAFCRLVDKAAAH